MDRTIEKQAIRQQRTWKMKLRFTDSDLKKSSMMFIITNIILCSATFGQDVYDPLFHFSFDGHAKDSLGKTVLEAQESFLWRRPVVEPQDLEFSGNALYVNRGGGKQSYIFRTPSLDYDKFTVVLRVKPECSPKDRINLVTGGYWLRWFTMFRNDLGELCVALNNERIVNKTSVSIDSYKWSTIVCRVDLTRKVVSTYVNGKACPDFRLPDEFQLSALTPKWKKKFELKEKHWMFDNRGCGRNFKGIVDEFMVFNSLVEPDVALEYFSFSQLEKKLVLGGESVSDRKQDGLFATINRRMEEFLQNAGFSPSDDGLLDCLDCFASREKAEKRIAELTQVLGDADYKKRKAATSHLRIIGAPALAQLMEVRRATAAPELRFRAKSLVKAMEKSADLNSSSNAELTLAYISFYPSSKYVPYLFSCLAMTRDDSTRVRICQTIQACVSLENQTFVRNRLSSSDKWIRLAAVCALAKLPAYDLLKEELKPFLTDQDELLQLSAVSALQKNYPDSVQSPLKKLVQSQNWKVRIIAERLSARERTFQDKPRS